ncbi:MAG: DegT/DnrJ/EryC1/StrS family aminotransferase, partial [Gemmatimonadales bacterium]
MRRQPPVHSPLNAGSILDSARVVGGWGPDPRAGLGSFLRDRYQAAAATLLGSGTQALQLSIHLASRRVGGHPTVALPAYTCFDVAAAAVGAGVSLTLYDVDPANLAPDLDSLRRAFDEGARIVVIAPLYGVPVDWDAIAACAAAAGAFLIEDAAQGHAASWRGRPLGTLAALSILSFGRGKGWTGGRGGAVLARGGVHSSGDPPAEGPGLWNETVTLAGAAAHCALGRPSLFG